MTNPTKHAPTYSLTEISVQGETHAVFEVYEDETKEQTLGFIYDESKIPLVSAAPDLLDALTWITRCASIKGPAGTTGYLISDEFMEKAKAAILKATPDEA